MKTVSEILRHKGTAVWWVTSETLVYDALELMAEKEIGALLIKEDGGVVGILSERDYARKVILKGRSSLATPVRDIMTRPVVCVHPEQTVDECMALMTSRRIRHLPVILDGEVVGLVSIGDLVKASLDEKDFLIQQLEGYITGGR